MASVFGHVVSAIGIGSVFPRKEMTAKVFLIGAISASMPDLDVISWYLDVYGMDMLEHRGLTHSLPFALLWSVLLVFGFHKQSEVKTKLWFYYFLCTASHGLIDGCTTGGDGIAYFAPFSSFRTHLPFEVIQVSPLGVKRFFSEWGLKVIKSELIWIGIPSLCLMIAGAFFRKFR